MVTRGPTNGFSRSAQHRSTSAVLSVAFGSRLLLSLVLVVPCFGSWRDLLPAGAEVWVS